MKEALLYYITIQCGSLYNHNNKYNNKSFTSFSVENKQKQDYSTAASVSKYVSLAEVFQ